MENSIRALCKAYEKAARYRRARALLNQLREDAKSMKKRIKVLENRLEVENEDAQRLEAGGVSAILSRILGSYDAQLEQAWADRNYTKVKHEEAVNGLRVMQDHIMKLEAECSSLEGSEEVYCTLYEQRLHMLMQNGSNAEYRFISMHREIERIKTNIFAIDEAMIAGENVVRLLQDASMSLENANTTYGQRGGMLFRMEELDSAETNVEEAQTLLDEFNAKLAEIRLIPEADDEDMPQFTEVCMNEMILEWLRADRIERSLDNVQRAKKGIIHGLQRLKKKQECERLRLRSLEDELLVSVLGAC